MRSMKRSQQGAARNRHDTRAGNTAPNDNRVARASLAFRSDERRRFVGFDRLEQFGSVRLYFHRVKEEVDPDIRILTTKKANYGPIGAETRVRWQAGVFVPVGMADVPGETRQARAERVFLKLLREHIDLGVFLKFGKSSQNYAPKVFAQHPSSEGIKIFEFSRAMDNLRKDGKITTFQVGKNRNGKHEIHVWLPELSAAPLEPPPFSPLENAPFPFTQRGTDK